MTDSMVGSPYGTPPRTWPTRVAGAGVVLAGCALLASLLTYHVEQVGWGFLNAAGHDKAAQFPCTNLLGLCGMYLAGLLYCLLGVVAVYGAMLIIVPGCGMMLWPTQRRTGQWLALLVMLITACAVMAVQPWFFIRWAKEMQVASPGGALGYLDGTRVAEALLGKTWALSLLLLVHAGALIYFARLTPAGIYRTEKEDVLTLWRRWRESRRLAREEKEAAAMAWQKPMTPDAGDDYFTTRPMRPDPAARQRTLHLPDPPDPVEPPAYPTPAPKLPPEPAPTNRPEDTPYTPPEPPARATHAPRVERPHHTRLGKPDNLLDLMQQVEDEIERRSTSTDTDDDEPFMRINPLTESAMQRHMGLSPAPSSPKIREPQPAQPAPAAHPMARPAPAPEPRRPAPAAPAMPARAMAVDDESDYPMPPYELLRYEPPSNDLREAAQEEMQETQAIIADTLESFRISVQPGEITRGPSITRYEFAVLRGQSVKSVVNKKNDLMAATSSASVNILAPIPGKSTVGIELQNSVMEPVYLRELLQSDEFHNPKMRLPVALGKNVYGKPVIGDLAAMPHVLVAGTTGSGKSVCINSMLISLLYKFRPDELKLILVDPKQVEMQPYKKLPHLAVPVVTDPARVIGALRWAVNEMEHRYKLFSKMGVRNLEDFNKLPPDAQPVQDDDDEPAPDYPEVDMRDADAIVRDIEDSQGIEDIPEEDEQGELDFDDDNTIPSKLPYIVIVVDELADLMLQVKEDLENYIGRLTQKARAAGIHMVVATQTPRSQVVTGTIKTNLPCRIALKVSSQLDSRVILDDGGAENLLGKGDLLFLPPGGPSKMTRAQGAFVTDEEIASIIKFCAAHAKQNFVQSATAALNDNAAQPAPGSRGTGRGADREAPGMDEELYTRCVNLVVTERKASTTLLQRRFRIGYGKAAEIMELMEKRGVVAPSTGSSRPREVLIEEAP